MESKELIDKFFESGNIAVVGATEDRNKFGNTAYTELKGRGFSIFPVNDKREIIGGEKCFNSLKELPANVEDAALIIQSAETLRVINDAAQKGIRRLWFQPGSESDEAIELCRKNNIEVIIKKCVLMYAPPVKGFHKFHRGVWKILGKL